MPLFSHQATQCSTRVKLSPYPLLFALHPSLLLAGMVLIGFGRGVFRHAAGARLGVMVMPLVLVLGLDVDR